MIRNVLVVVLLLMSVGYFADSVFYLLFAKNDQYVGKAVYLFSVGVVLLLASIFIYRVLPESEIMEEVQISRSNIFFMGGIYALVTYFPGLVSAVLSFVRFKLASHGGGFDFEGVVFSLIDALVGFVIGIILVIVGLRNSVK